MRLPPFTRYVEHTYLFSPNHQNVHSGKNEAMKAEASSPSEFDSSGASIASELQQVANRSPKAPEFTSSGPEGECPFMWEKRSRSGIGSVHISVPHRITKAK